MTERRTRRGFAVVDSKEAMGGGSGTTSETSEIADREIARLVELRGLE
jgi:hypothetical protein